MNCKNKAQSIGICIGSISFCFFGVSIGTLFASFGASIGSLFSSQMGTVIGSGTGAGIGVLIMGLLGTFIGASFGNRVGRYIDLSKITYKLDN